MPVTLPQALCQVLGPASSLKTMDLSGNCFTNVGVAMLVNQLQVVVLVVEMVVVVEVEVEVVVVVMLTLLQRSPLMASLDLSKNATDAGVARDV
jgi:hypothetical protein